MGIKASFLKFKNRLGLFFWLWFGLFASPFLIWGMWQVHDFFVNDGDLVVAFGTALPPHRSLKKGERCSHGFDYSIAYFIAQRLHKNLKIKEIPFNESMAALKAGTIDLICASLSMTDERLRDMAMAHVYGGPTSYMTMIFLNSPFYAELSSLAQPEVPVNKVKFLLKDSLIGFLSGKVWPSVLERYGFHNFKSYDCETDMVSALELGQVSAVVISEFEANFLHKQDSNIQVLHIVLDEPWSHGAGIAIKKDRKDLIKNVTEVIQDLKNEGVIALEQQRWFGRVCN